MFKNKKKTANAPAKPAAKTPTTSTASKAEPKKPDQSQAKAAENIITVGTVVEGNVISEGDIQLAGKVKGDVTTKSKLVVEETAHIEGNITAENADIAGSVTGTVNVSGLLTIRQSSKIDGDVNTKNLNVESGSLFTGRFQVGGSTKMGSSKTAVDSVLD